MMIYHDKYNDYDKSEYDSGSTPSNPRHSATLCRQSYHQDAYAFDHDHPNHHQPTM